MANFYLVCGIGGGGKTILSKQIVAKNPGIVFMDADMYYERINGDECDRRNPFEVWHLIFREIHEFEVAGKDVLLTANSLTLCQRNQFIEWFPSFKHHMIWVTAPWKVCVKGNASRRRNIPVKVLKQQWKSMEPPYPFEKGWDTITQVSRDDNEYIVFNLKGNIKNFIKF